MHEIELKLQVPPRRRADVRSAVATSRASRIRLQAHYYDTEDRRLAAAGIALRLRKEGRRWVQAVKAQADGPMVRFEHEADLGTGSRVPAVDPTRHAGTPPGDRLMHVVGEAAAALHEVFATDVRRTLRHVRAAPGTVVEVACDEGVIRAGDEALPICEIEFELVRGAASAVPLLAARWAQRYGLWLDTRSKAERGKALAEGRPPLAARSRAPALHAGMSGSQALRAMAGAALEQVLDNASQLTGGPAGPEHLHQLRVGLRRLRTALHDFGGLDAAMPAAGGAWLHALGELSRAVGAARDLDALQEGVLPALAAAGAPPLALPQHDRTAPGEMLRAPEVTALWLELLAWLHAPDPTPPQPPGNLRASLPPVLDRLHRHVAQDAARFAQLTPAGQHRTRKRIKRLRYGVEFCSALFPSKAVARYLALLRPSQEALGAAHDLVVARELFEPLVATDPRAWFALGWLAARQHAVLQQCAEALQALAGAHGFWGGRR